MSLPALDAAALDELYDWLNGVPFSRPRRNIARDFSDGVLIAELIAHFLPRYVDLHLFMPASSTQLKKYNWDTLNKVVFSCLNFHVPSNVVEKILSQTPGAIEYVLYNLRIKIELAVSEKRFRPHRYRSRSTARATGSTTSLASDTSDDNMSLSGERFSRSASSSRTTKKKIMPDLAKFNISKTQPTINGDRPANTKFQDMVPARSLHIAQQELIQKDEQIQTLYVRVRHLEQLVALKDERIASLAQRLDKLAQAYYDKASPPPPPPDEPSQQQQSATQLLAQLVQLRTSLNDGGGGGDRNGTSENGGQAPDTPGSETAHSTA